MYFKIKLSAFYLYQVSIEIHLTFKLIAVNVPRVIIVLKY